MSSFPRSPRFTKGALISYDPLKYIPQVIIFQYNPETLSRKLQAQRTSREGISVETQLIKGPPIETIDLSIELDASEQLEKPNQNPTAVAMGIYPQLSALEMILYPKSSWVIEKTALASAGAIEIAPAEEPFTLFIWGANRVVPVSITSFSIKELNYDSNLRPIQAEVSMSLQVLTYDNFGITHPGFALSLTHQIVKETMAAAGSINNTTSLGDVKVL